MGMTTSRNVTKRQNTTRNVIVWKGTYGQAQDSRTEFYECMYRLHTYQKIMGWEKGTLRISYFSRIDPETIP